MSAQYLEPKNAPVPGISSKSRSFKYFFHNFGYIKIHIKCTKFDLFLSKSCYIV